MSEFKVLKKFNKKRKTDSSANLDYYDFWDLNGAAGVEPKYVYVPDVKPGMCLLYRSTSVDAPNTNSDKIILLTGKLTNLSVAPTIRSAIITTATSEDTTDTELNSNRDGSIFFELFGNSSTDYSQLATISKLNSLNVIRNYPNSKAYQLMNGGIAKYTPNIKHAVSISASYLTSDELDKILNFFEDPVMIVPENDSGKSPFHSSRIKQLGRVQRSGSSASITILSQETPTTDYGFGSNTYTDNANILDGVGGVTWGATIPRYFIWMDGSVDRVSYVSNTSLTVKETLSGTTGDKNSSGFKSGGLLSPIRNFESQGYFYCNLMGDSVDFQYTTSIKDSGYSGTLNFQEI